MTPKEKAADLLHHIQWNTLISKKKVKQCALIAVDELIYETQFEVPNIRQSYWKEVKKEIEKI